MTRMKLGSDGFDYVFLRAGIHPTLGHLAGTPVNDFVPLRLCIGIHGVVKAGDELMSQICPVLLRQGQHFSNFLSGHAHVRIISPTPGDKQGKDQRQDKANLLEVMDKGVQ